MEPTRRQEIAASLSKDIEEKRLQLSRNALLEWLAWRLQIYVIRWTRICTPDVPMAVLIAQALFPVVEIGTDAMAKELATVTISDKATVAWSRYVVTLDMLKCNEERNLLKQIEGDINEFVSAIQTSGN